MRRTGLHLGNWGTAPADTVRRLITEARVPLLLAMENTQPDSLLFWADQPYARFLVLRKHFAADGLATQSQVVNWANGQREMIANFLSHAAFRRLYDNGGVIAKIFNEPNMIGRAEGFGTDTEAMKRYNDLFPVAADIIKSNFPKVQAAGYSMTPGNRDVYFSSAPTGVDYWLHGPEAARDNPTPAQIDESKWTCLTRDAMAAMDVFGVHIYTEWLSHWNAPFLGFRFQKMWKFLPERLAGNTFVLEMSIADNPVDVFGPAVSALHELDRKITDPLLQFDTPPDDVVFAQFTEQDRQRVRAEGIDKWLRFVRAQFPQIQGCSDWWGRPGDGTWEKHFHSEPDGSWRPVAFVVKNYNLEVGDPLPPGGDPGGDPPPPPDVPDELPPRDIQLGPAADWVTFTPAAVAPGEKYWRLVRARYVGPEASGHKHHIYSMTPHDANVRTEVHNTGTGDRFSVPHEKPESEPAANVAMYGVGNVYTVQVSGYGITASDRMAGLLLPQNQHVLYEFWWELVMQPAQDDPAQTLRQAAWETAKKRQLISPNPNAALEKAAWGHGYRTALGNEFTIDHAGQRFVCQHFYKQVTLADGTKQGRERVYWVEYGDWSNVQYFNQ